jgi:hypothetical protein
MTEKPFRWNLTHRNHLGNLIEGKRAQTLDGFEDDLLLRLIFHTTRLS